VSIQAINSRWVATVCLASAQRRWCFCGRTEIIGKRSGQLDSRQARSSLIDDDGHPDDLLTAVNSAIGWASLVRARTRTRNDYGRRRQVSSKLSGIGATMSKVALLAHEATARQAGA